LSSAARLAAAALALAALVPAMSPAETAAAGKNHSACPNDDSGLILPAGFCAGVFADEIGHSRHLVVAPNGVVYVNTWSGVYYGNDTPHAGGFLVALKDSTGSGKADVNQRFGETVQTGGAGGTGIGFYNGSLYAEINDKIVRYALPAAAMVPSGSAQTVVAGLPLGGDHPMHPFAIDASGVMYIDVGTATNSCQPQNRTLESPGAKPCTELETRGGIWRYDANKTDQRFSPAERYATGIRNGEGFAVDTAGRRVFVTQHGRDQLRSNWPAFYELSQEATLPAEELLRLEKGGDYGWPECYFDSGQHKLMLAPEYGGDGHRVGVCAAKIAPVTALCSMTRNNSPATTGTGYSSRFTAPGIGLPTRRKATTWYSSPWRATRRRESARSLPTDLPARRNRPTRPRTVPRGSPSVPTDRCTFPTMYAGESTASFIEAVPPPRAMPAEPCRVRVLPRRPAQLPWPKPSRRRARTPAPRMRRRCPFRKEPLPKWSC
jgi:glucose/arabinose dehydrogenase